MVFGVFIKDSSPEAILDGIKVAMSGRDDTVISEALPSNTTVE